MMQSINSALGENMDADVSKASFTVSYDGVARVDDHTMDVELLAPALLGIGRLIREANTEFNGKKAKADVRVISDFEHKCFQINFDTVLTFLEQVKNLLDSSNVKTAKDILEWLGLLGITGGGAGYVTYLGYLKIRRGRKIVNQQQITDQSGEGMVALTFEGDANVVNVHQHVYNLGENKKALVATRQALSPIGQDGFNRLETKADDNVLETIDSAEADHILASVEAATSPPEAIEDDVVTSTPITAWLSVYSPVYDEKADKWRFVFGAEHIYVDISETTIARDALARGGALADDTYQVRMEVTEPDEGDGRKGKASYKILKVLKFIPAVSQGRQLDLEELLDEHDGQSTKVIEGNE